MRARVVRRLTKEFCRCCDFNQLDSNETQIEQYKEGPTSKSYIHTPERRYINNKLISRVTLSKERMGDCEL